MVRAALTAVDEVLSFFADEPDKHKTQVKAFHRRVLVLGRPPGHRQ